MPASACTNPVVLDLGKDNGRVQFRVELVWDGTSVPPNCDGTVSRVSWNNTGLDTWYAHIANTKLGPAVYTIVPGNLGSVTDRNVLHAGGLDTRSDLTAGLDLNRVPPQQGERLLN